MDLDPQKGLEHILELMGYLYVEAMLHGYKHGLQTLEESAIYTVNTKDEERLNN